MSFSGVAAWRWFAPSCALAVVACTSATSSIQVRTDGRLRVLPPEFTADVGCSFASGDASELSHYVATLVDLGLSPDAETEGQVTDGATYPNEAGSGVAARCTSTTTFSTSTSDSGLIEVGHLYAAIVDGYAGAEPPDVSGGRNAKNWSPPVWQWLCGVGGLDETQLRWLEDQVKRLPTAPFVPPPVVPTPSDAGTSANSSAVASSTSSAVVDTSSPGDTAMSQIEGADGTDAGTDVAKPALTSSSAPDAAMIAPDASSDGGLLADATSESATQRSSVDAAAAMSTDTAATSATDAASATSIADAAIAPDAASGDAESTHDWWTQLLLAAQGDFAPPPKVVSGGQSGVRGCVPLF